MFVKLMLAAILAIPAVFVGMSVYSHFKTPAAGLVNGMLRPCPLTPNCVCSESIEQSDYARIEPLKSLLDEQKVDAGRVIMVIEQTGGKVLQQSETYVHAIYVTPVMRYVDDVEFRYDVNASVWHIRSASRVGRSDMQANRARVNKLRAILN